MDGLAGPCRCHRGRRQLDANFALIEAFPIMQAAFGLPTVMVILAALSVLAIVFISKFLPETKSLSVEEVVAVFDRQAAGEPARPARPAHA